MVTDDDTCVPAHRTAPGRGLGARSRAGRAVIAVAGAALLVTSCGTAGTASPEPTGDVPPVTSSPAETSPTEPSPTEPSSTETSQTAPPDDASPSAPPLPAGTPGEVEEVVDGLPLPWSMAALPDGDVLVSLRDEARILRVDTGEGSTADVPTTEEDGSFGGADPGGEGGLLGITLSPTFADDGLLYAYVTRADDNAVVRAVYDGTSLGEPEVLLEGIPAAAIHNGGRLAFGPDGMLYATTGDAREASTAQDPGSLAGKVLRLTPDGQAAPGNPTEGSPVWSLGHRNVQGLDWDASGRLYASEFGQDTWDEVNLVTPGANYGWPQVEGPGGDDAVEQGFTDPLVWWEPAEASPSGAAVTADAVWVSALRGERLWRVPVDTTEAGGPVGTPEPYLAGELGRLRDVEPTPDGTGLWVLTNRDDGDDQLVRVPLG